MAMNEFYLSLGSNCGDRKKNVEQAIEWLRETVSIERKSSLYETPEIHGLDRLYYNAVAKGFTTASFAVFNKLLKDYERNAGRDEGCRAKGDVPIDLDIVLWNEETLRPKDFSQEFFLIGYREIQ